MKAFTPSSDEPVAKKAKLSSNRSSSPLLYKAGSWLALKTDTGEKSLSTLLDLPLLQLLCIKTLTCNFKLKYFINRILLKYAKSAISVNMYICNTNKH